MNYDQFPPLFWKHLHLKPFAFNDRLDLLSNVWGICPEELNPTIISTTSQHISFSIDKDGQTLFFAAIYASTSYSLRRHLRSDLALLQ